MIGRALPSLFALLLGAAAPMVDDPAAARARMVRELEQTVQVERQPVDPRVLEAMREVPRHLLVPEQHRRSAYQDHPLPIGEGQTISQPTIVAMMTDLLDPDPGDRVLEVGTGSGYQAAVLSQLVDHVYSIEIVEPLARRAAARLAELGYGNVTVRAGDGYAGWPEHAPFDAIIVTAGATHIPQPLVDQLKPGGRMVIPLGPSTNLQELVLVTKDEAGRVTRRTIIPVRFVPLTGDGQRRGAPPR